MYIQLYKISNICRNFRSTLIISIINIIKQYETFISLAGKNRTKRGLINAVGEFENRVFGTVGDSDITYVKT